MTKTALVIIDLQNDYYPDGKWTLDGIEAASANASKMVEKFRQSDDLIVHVHHNFVEDDAPFFVAGSPGAEIHRDVAPKDGEPQVLKHQVNAFHETDLQDVLGNNGVENLVICGAMSHMCVDAATRAASDLGYTCTVIHDACASRDLEFEGETIPARQAHAAYMSALGFAYATLKSTDEYLSGDGD
ncbi:MAG: cysteine hydrolase family protein [Pseudomonadota bacterium]